MDESFRFILAHTPVFVSTPGYKDSLQLINAFDVAQDIGNPTIFINEESSNVESFQVPNEQLLLSYLILVISIIFAFWPRYRPHYAVMFTLMVGVGGPDATQHVIDI